MASLWGHRLRGEFVESKLTFIAPQERPGLDASQLEALCAELGVPAAEDVLCRAMEELGARLCQVHEDHAKGKRPEMLTGLRRIRAIADQIGLSGVARVAGDVLSCMAHHDGVAEAATMARLARIGERSLSALWDLQDVTV